MTTVASADRPRLGRNRRESGFAMLMVFLMAAVFAITLYMEVPRLAMEAQRTREALLIARGEEYKRGIYMFVKQNKRWPARIEELESLNNQRFLRRRYEDPMTGSKDWRVIHVVNGVLTDSVTNKPPQQPGDPNNVSSMNGQSGSNGSSGSSPGSNGLNGSSTTGSGGFQWGQSSYGSSDSSAPNAAQAGAILATRRRASDTMPIGQPGGVAEMTTPPDPNNPNSGTPGMNGVPVSTNLPPGVPGALPGIPGVPAMPGSTGIPGQPGMVNGQPIPGAIPPPGVPGQSPFPGQNGSPVNGLYPMPLVPTPGGQLPDPSGQPVNSQIGGVSPYATTPGSNGVPPGFAQPGNPANSPLQGANQAQQMIQAILTSPRPGGMPAGAGGMIMGSGIAGFASTADATGIKVYHDRTNYKEWEFIFDPAKIPPLQNPLGGGAGTPASAMGGIGGQPIGTPVTSIGSGFGSTPSSPSPGFGSPSLGNPGYTVPAVPGSGQMGTPGFVTDVGTVIKQN